MENSPASDVPPTQTLGSDFACLATGLLFLAVILVFSFYFVGPSSNQLFLAIAAVFGGYMAMNIGANDVANNVGPAVGSKAMTMGWAIVIAMVFEASGAFIAGGDVVSTIKKGIIDIEAFGENTDHFLWAMMAALLAAALWLNLATWARAPVSTTHSIVGGVMGAGIAAAGFSIVDWGTMAKIASSWVISPVIGGVIAALFLFAIKKTIVFKEDKMAASYRWVPIYVAVMAWAFVTYLVLKGLKKIWPQMLQLSNDLLFFTVEVTKKPTFPTALLLGGIGDSLHLGQLLAGVDRLPKGLKETDTINYRIQIVDVFTPGEFEIDKILQKANSLQLKKETIARKKEVEKITLATIEKFNNGELEDDLNYTHSGLKYILHQKGKGKKVTPLQKVKVQYMGFLSDGKVFDTSFDDGNPIVFPLGAGKVIKGWDEGISKLTVGSSATFFIPYQLAYGIAGWPGKIPNKADLVFYIELISSY